MGQKTLKVDKIVPEGNALHISSNLEVGNVYVSSNLKVDTTTISTTVTDGVPPVSWATSIGGTGSDSGYGIATDSGGNVYVIGNYTGSVTIGSTTLTSAGSSDAFVAKYDTSGTVQWATSIGGTTTDSGFGITTDSGGNVYVIGDYSASVTIGSTTLTSAGSYDTFVAKYDTSGTVQWATSIGGTSTDSGLGIATDSNGNVYVTGNYAGSITIGSTILNSMGYNDAFVAKYDTSGTVQWATSISGTGFEIGRGIATDSGGNVYVTGIYTSSITIGSTTLTSAGSYDAFVAKYDTSGTVQWATSIGGTSSDYGRGIATDSNGNVYVTGNYAGTATFAPGTTLTSAGGADAYVVKYDTSGTFQWVTSIGGTSTDAGRGIATDSDGNVYVIGEYIGTLTIGSTTLTNAGFYDAFVAKCDTSGTVQWATSIGGTSSDYGYGIATDSNGNVYVTGNYAGTATFAPGTTLTSAGGSDAYVVKYSPPKNLRINTGLEVGTANIYVDTASGRVGIGTSTPGYTLDVQGDLNVSGTTTNVSDKRLKSNVHVIENALEKVVKLSGYTFTMNNKQNAGVIAQEVLEVLPEVVGGSEETTYSVAYGNMASLFIEAIKELKREIEVLKTKN
jgi:Tfp pilus assembly protein PilZ